MKLTPAASRSPPRGSHAEAVARKWSPGSKSISCHANNTPCNITSVSNPTSLREASFWVVLSYYTSICCVSVSILSVFVRFFIISVSCIEHGWCMRIEENQFNNGRKTKYLTHTTLRVTPFKCGASHATAVTL